MAVLERTASQALIKPRILRPGAVVGVTAPAGASDNLEQVQEGLAILAKLGLNPRLGDTVRARRGYLAGSDEMRASELTDMFADPEIEAIFCVRGGWGCLRMLEKVDFGIIRAHPKLFVGYSDVTSLHLAIGQRTGVVTLHGPMVFEFARMSPLTMRMMKRTLFECEALGTIFPVDGHYAIKRGRCQGLLTGGNLSLVASSLGTPYEIETTNRILFLEDIDEEPYRVDRMLTQLKLAGKLESAAGIVFGVLVNCDPKPDKPSLTLKEVLFDHLGSLPIPSYYGLPCGHGEHNVVLPMGVRVAVDAGCCQLEILEAATKN